MDDRDYAYMHYVIGLMRERLGLIFNETTGAREEVKVVAWYKDRVIRLLENGLFFIHRIALDEAGELRVVREIHGPDLDTRKLSVEEAVKNFNKAAMKNHPLERNLISNITYV